jgi:heat-inducible transcriptional repressor
MNRPQLDERLRRILTFVVESHVSRAEPVGSQYVRAAYHLSISPATIRNAMQRLEDLGLLGHPHTSAGRVPTEAGYRYYVDELMRPEPLAPSVRRTLDPAIDRVRRSEEGIETGVPGLLAKASRQLGVVAMRARGAWPVDRVNLVALEGGVVVLAIGGREGAPATATWRPDPIPSAEDLAKAEAWIRARLPLSGAAALAALAAKARAEAPAEIHPILADALPLAARLALEQGEPAVRIEGADNIAAQPEFQEPARLRPLVSLLAERGPLTQALEAFATSVTPRVRIGQENAPAAIRECSLVGVCVSISGARGVVGVMGPVRMPYRRVVSLVAYIGDRLGGAEE